MESQSLEPLRVTVVVQPGPVFVATCHEIGLTVGGLSLDDLRSTLQQAIAQAMKDRGVIGQARPVLIAFE